MRLLPASNQSSYIRFDKKRLLHLYAVERLPLVIIAEEFGVSYGIIKRALEFHRISKRPPLEQGGKYLSRLRKLAVGETIEIDCSIRRPRAGLFGSARLAKIKVKIRLISSSRFRITRTGGADDSQDSLLLRISRSSLEEMYTDRRLKIKQIADHFDCRISEINRALKLHGIAPRPRPRGTGKHTSVFKDLAVGETVDMRCTAKQPGTNLHTIATRIGIKISLRRVADGQYRVTRLG